MTKRKRERLKDIEREREREEENIEFEIKEFAQILKQSCQTTKFREQQHIFTTPILREYRT